MNKLYCKIYKIYINLIIIITFSQNFIYFTYLRVNHSHSEMRSVSTVGVIMIISTNEKITKT